MAEISASLVMKLRKMSGQGMMDCKKALTETNGDIDEAMALLRKKGLATLEKRAGRETTEGKVVCRKSDDGKIAVMATLCCETDFVSKGDDFAAAANLLGDYCLACGDDGSAEAVLATELNGKKFSEVITDIVSKIGEKTEVGESAKYELSGCGVIGTYVHFNDKIGSMIEIEAGSDEVSGKLDAIAVDIAMHITAMNPAGLDRDSIPADVIEKERAIAAEQVKNKPPEILEKIVEGKLGKFFKERCLVDQKFVKDDTKTVGQALSDAAGGEVKIKRFIRFEIG